MSTARQGAPGDTRVCPHCRNTILESAAICPVCRHHLRVGTRTTAGTGAAAASFSPLRVESTIRHPDVGEGWEYSVLLTVRDERGEEVSRQVMGVGGLRPNEQRSFVLEVEVFTPAGTTVRAGPGAEG